VPRHTEAVKKFKYPPHIYANVFQCTFSVFKYACPWLLVFVFLLAFGFFTCTEQNKWLFKLNKQFWHANQMFFLYVDCIEQRKCHFHLAQILNILKINIYQKKLTDFFLRSLFFLNEILLANYLILS